MKTIFKWVLMGLAGAALLVALVLRFDVQGQPETAGQITGGAQPASWVESKVSDQRAAAAQWNEATDKQILFGDLHVHSTFSMDAFLWALPTMNGEGLHPPADACDYARYCSSLDFWSLTDHAEALTPRHWSMIKDTVRQCNALTDPENPDLVTYLGWEWTQVGQTAESHYGHRNVVLLEQDDDKVPARPITSGGLPLLHMRRPVLNPVEEALAPYITNFAGRSLMKSQFLKQADLRETTLCDNAQSVHDLPPDCVESAETPAELWKKLDEWGFPAMAIPHGTTWGFYTPPGVKWDKQLSSKEHDPKYQPLIEVFSGHGNSEEYRDWRAMEFGPNGEQVCPEPRDGYLPCCHRAGELIRERCEDPGSAECQAKVDKAEADYLDATVAGHLVVPGAKPEDWLNCGQCPDCYLPALNYRPGNSVQYIQALSNFAQRDDNGDPQRFRFGFIASSDNHAAQPGTGYKEQGRHQNTESFGATDSATRRNFMDRAKRKGEGGDSIPFDRVSTHMNLFQYSESERLGSFFYTGGLVAVHSEGRRREQIWDAMQRKEVYGTSGDRILLWFDLVNGPAGEVPMGGDVRLAEAPTFRVRAIGAFEQKPGCPAHSIDAVGSERLDTMCGGECYNPGDVRKSMERIEVIRIRPQDQPGEDIASLIDDPWRTFACAGDSQGCQVEFSDPDFVAGGREVMYYVRAIQAPSATINGGGLRCEPGSRVEECKQVQVCYGDDRTERADDCLQEQPERAWSSPIFVMPERMQ